VDAQCFLDNLETELELRNPGASGVVRQAGADVTAMAKLLRENLPNIISKRWEPGASKAVLEAQLEDIVTAMENSRPYLLSIRSLGSVVPPRELAEQLKGRGPYTPIWNFSTHSGLLHNRVPLDESFPMGPCSTSGDRNSLIYDLGPHHCDCHERQHSVEKRLLKKRLKRLKCTYRNA
jgi:hypothetical protein